MFCDGGSVCLRSTLGQGLRSSRSLRRMYHQMNGRLSGNGITSKSDLCSITLYPDVKSQKNERSVFELWNIVSCYSLFFYSLPLFVRILLRFLFLTFVLWILLVSRNCSIECIVHQSREPTHFFKIDFKKPDNLFTILVRYDIIQQSISHRSGRI